MRGNIIEVFNPFEPSKYPLFDFACLNDLHSPSVVGILTKIKGFRKWISTELVDWTKNPVQFKQIKVWESFPVGVFSIKKHLLWKIGLDLKHQRSVRVVNYELKRENNQLKLCNVFIGWRGMITYFARNKTSMNSNYALNWNQFQPFFEPRCHPAFEKMEWFHPADIADMMRMLPFSHQLQLIKGLKPILAANTIRELEAHFQYPILDKLPANKITEILSVLPSNHASAILREYKDPEKIVKLIANPLQNSIRQQLRYDPSTAGAWMDMDFFSFSSDSTCQDCLSYLRSHSLPPESIFYIYIENEKKEFIGVVSIRSVIMAEPETKLEMLMKKNLIVLSVHTPKVEVANIMSRYHLLALPVVDEEKKISGVIKIHDVLASTLEYPV